MLVLVGDIFDLEKGCPYFDAWQRRVVELFQAYNASGKLVYVSGNHDPLDYLEDVRPWTMYGGPTDLCPTTESFLKLGHTENCYVFHGDVIDRFYKQHRHLSRVGGRVYDALVAVNRSLNACLKVFNLPEVHISKYLKLGAKYATGLFKKFPGEAAEEARSRDCNNVLCGHIHHPGVELHQEVTYVNCGDWVENCTAAIWENNRWRIHRAD